MLNQKYFQKVIKTKYPLMCGSTLKGSTEMKRRSYFYNNSIDKQIQDLKKEIITNLLLRFESKILVNFDSTLSKKIDYCINELENLELN